MVTVYKLGVNNTITESSKGPVFPYEYKRTINNRNCTYITYSFSLEELEKLHKKEVKEYEQPR